MMSCKSRSKMSLDIDASRIGGNGSSELKQIIVLSSNRAIPGFAQLVGGRLQVTEVSIDNKVEEPEKVESRVGCEAVVDKGT
jgi:acyl-coenzyme A thioesterase 13